MKVRKTITLKVNKENKVLSFGIPDNDEELQEMFKFRYKIYLQHNYISENLDQKDIDEYDGGLSKYFIASVDNRIIGTIRLIRDTYLPTEKDCFKFAEPQSIANIPSGNRAELGRLIIEKYSDKIFLPRHLVLLGLLLCVTEYALENDLRGGYSFIKNSLKIKLDKLKFPFHSIENFEQVYNQKLLSNYFNSIDDPVWPIYYLTFEVNKYLNKIFSNKIFFKKVDNNFVFRNQFIFNILSK